MCVELRSNDFLLFSKSHLLLTSHFSILISSHITSHTHTQTLSRSISHTHTLFFSFRSPSLYILLTHTSKHTHTHTYTHSLYLSLSLTHTNTLSLFLLSTHHTHTHSITLTHTNSMHHVKKSSNVHRMRLLPIGPSLLHISRKGNHRERETTYNSKTSQKTFNRFFYLSQFFFLFLVIGQKVKQIICFKCELKRIDAVKQIQHTNIILI